MFKHIDAFAGVGGFRLGVEHAAKTMEVETSCVMSIENDVRCQEVYRDNFGQTPEGDITKLPLSTIPEHDLLTAGFPCQPFSRNGKFYNKNGKFLGEDDRSNLFLHLVNILRAKQPKYFVFENVKGILRMKNKDGSLVIETIMNNLSEAGYNASYSIHNSHNYGLPQHRDRVIIVGARKELPKIFIGDPPSPTITCVRDILQTKVLTKYSIEHLWRKRIIRLGAVQGARVRNHPFSKGTSRIVVIKWLYERAIKPKTPTGTIRPLGIIYGDIPSGLPRQQDKLYSIMGLSPTLATFAKPVFDTPEGLRALTPRECFRLQGFPDTFKLYRTDTAAYKQAGNAVSVNTIEHIMLAVLKNYLELPVDNRA